MRRGWGGRKCKGIKENADIRVEVALKFQGSM